MPEVARPPYDPELEAGLALLPPGPALNAETLPALRPRSMAAPLATSIDDGGVEVLEYLIPGYGGEEIELSIIRRKGHSRNHVPAVFHLHGGGMVSGNRWVGADVLANWARDYDVVTATVEYRLAPEHPDPIPVEDSYAALEWFVAHSEELGFSADRVMIYGGSAGGGLAAGVTLMARDRGGPALAAQLLVCPMLDDRNHTVSSRQYIGTGTWDRNANLFGWTALLGDRFGSDDVSIYAAPGRATNLSSLPPTYIDAGSAEVFRDEDIAYAQGIWAAGGEAELHIWNGGFHGFEMITTAAVSQLSAATREAWVRRHLAN